MTPPTQNSHWPPETSLAEAFGAVTAGVDDAPMNGRYPTTTVKEPSPPWQHLAEQVAPMFSEALKAAAEALYRMTVHERATLERALAGTTIVAEELHCLSRDLQSIRGTVASLTESQLELAARTAEIEFSLEKKVSAALEKGVKYLDQGMRERQGAVEGKISAMADEVSRAGQRLQVHASAIRTLAEAVNSHVKRREELNEALQKLTEIAALPVALGPLPEGL